MGDMELKKLQNLAIADSGYIFDPASGNSYTANETALFIISDLKQGKSTEEIIVRLCEEYETDATTAETDTVRTIEQLQANYLI